VIPLLLSSTTWHPKFWYLSLNDPNIKKLRQQIEGAPQFQCSEPFNYEGNRETSNCELFADDENTFTVVDFASLSYIKKKHIR
jgi:hypothetical protein